VYLCAALNVNKCVWSCVVAHVFLCVFVILCFCIFVFVCIRVCLPFVLENECLSEYSYEYYCVRVLLCL